MKIAILTCAVSAVIAGPVLAESFDAAATGHGTASNEVMAVSEDLIVIHAASDYERFETADPDNPMASLKGPCFGAMVVDKGQVSGSGNCHYTDAGGDVAVMTWTAEGMGPDGKTLGSWAIAGGTGKWAAASGGGAFNAGTDAAGVYTNEVTGEVNIP